MKYNKLFFTIFLSCLLSIFMLTESKAQFKEIAKIQAPDAAAGHAFGASVSISGNRAIVGAGYGVGAAYIFEQDGNGIWQKVAKIQASDKEINDQFGFSVALDGDRAIVGSIQGESAYIFEKDGDNWNEVAIITASTPDANQDFGRSVAISGDHAIVGATADGNYAGAAYIFYRGNGTWSEVTKIIASDASTSSQFGETVSISGNYVIVGPYSNAKAYIFERDGSSWKEVAKIQSSDPGASTYFGRSVAINGNRAIVGDPYISSGNNYSEGAAYLFERDGSGNWNEVAKIKGSDTEAWDNFGYKVAINGNHAIVSAPGESTFGYSAGAAYVFKRNGSGNWSEVDKLVASDAEIFYNFGVSVGISGNNVIVGQTRLGVSGYENKESAYIFENNQSVQDLLSNLITSVDGSGIHKGTKRLLTGFLNSADKSLDRGRERIAILKLVAFKWLVKVQSPRKIDATLADEWIGKAEEIIDAIKTALPKSGELDELASEDVLPEKYNLNQNYPNPFNPTTTISYSIPENEYVTLSIYDALGKEVAVLDNGFRTAGNYSHTFDASDLSSGMYFYTIRSGNFVQTKKMLLMK